MPRIIGTHAGINGARVLGDLEKRDPAGLAAAVAVSLEVWFPWLGTDEDAGSGADVIEKLFALHAVLVREAKA